MYDATNQENTSLTRTVSALPVVIGRDVGNNGQHMSGGLAAPICATYIGIAATTGANGASSSPASMLPFLSSLAAHRTDPRYLMRPLGTPASQLI
jgi:hypothetical protein